MMMCPELAKLSQLMMFLLVVAVMMMAIMVTLRPCPRPPGNRAIR
jgi:hypothetical protein